MERIFFFTYQQGQTQKDSQIKGKSTKKHIFIHSAGKYDQDVKTLFLVLSTSSASLFTSCHLLLLYPKREEKNMQQFSSKSNTCICKYACKCLQGQKRGKELCCHHTWMGISPPPHSSIGWICSYFCLNSRKKCLCFR